MNNETQKVDVLYVIDVEIASHGKHAPQRYALQDARAAVADLIAAAKEVQADADMLGMTTNRLTAAIDRAGGAA